MMDASQAVSSEPVDTGAQRIVTACGNANVIVCRRYDINDMISGKLQLQLVPDEAQSHIMGDIDLKVANAGMSALDVYAVAVLTMLELTAGA